MSQSKRIEQELSSFILFGGLMTTPLRRFVAGELFHFLVDPDHPALENLRASTLPNRYPNWYQVLQQVFRQESLRQLSANNEDLAISLAQDLLMWIKKTAITFASSHDRVEEEEMWEAYQQKQSAPQTDWDTLLSDLHQRYPDHTRTWNFYQKTLHEQQRALSQQPDDPRLQREASVLHSKVLRDWGQFIQAHKAQQEASYLDQAYARYAKTLSRKVDKLFELGDLLDPFYNFLGRAWNDSLENWQHIDWDQLETFAETLQRDHSLRELAELLGKWKRAEAHQERVRMQRLVDRRAWKPNPYGRSEIIGIHYSADLNNLLPSEVALLSSPETEVLLSLKYVERKLLSFQYRSHGLSSSPIQEEEELEEPQPETAGPFVLCIDTSGSMFGAPERVAKALALAILEIAIQEDRQVYLISFSTGFKAIELTGIEQDLERFIAFLKRSFHGGTDIQPALEETLHVLEQDGYERADALIISDFVIPRMSREVFEQVENLRHERGTHFHSMFITRRADTRHQPLPIFDQHWVYDLDQPGVMRQAVDRLRAIREGG